MLWNNTVRQYTAVLVFAIVCGVGLAYFTVSDTKTSRAAVYAESAAACDETYSSDTEKIDCWYEVIRSAFVDGGTETAFDVFENMYQRYDIFSNTGCHRHAHRVGDMAYYHDYLTHKDFDLTTFPSNAKACGYGFYHGFFEHLVQDRSDPAFVTVTCDYMDERLSDIAPAIRQTCYHGAGHGFLLAGADKLTGDTVPGVQDLTAVPLTQCESLPGASAFEISECRQGVYNVTVDWMSDGEYGLSINAERPFAVCDAEPYERQLDCYYEMAQKVGGLVDNDPVRVAKVARQAKRTDLLPQTLAVTVAGIVQHQPKGDQSVLLTACRTFTDKAFEQCIAGIVGGLVEHDTSADRYTDAFGFCERDDLTDKEQTICYRTLALNVPRFLSLQEIQAMCTSGRVAQQFCDAAFAQFPS